MTLPCGGIRQARPGAGRASVSREELSIAIVAGGEPRCYASTGIDGSDVYSISAGRVAAVVSGLAIPRSGRNAPPGGPPRQVLKRLMDGDHAAADVVRHDRRQPGGRSQDPVAKSAGLPGATPPGGRKVEMGLRVTFDVPNIFEYFVNTHAELRLARDRLVGTHQEPSPGREDRSRQDVRPPPGRGPGELHQEGGAAF